jgi:hypothetical protein
VGSNPARGMDFVVSVVMSGRGFCIRIITLPEESYQVWCVRV